MATPNDKKQAAVFATYIKDKKILVADASATARASIHASLTQMGATGNNIVLAGSYSEAAQEIINTKPQVVICDYDLGQRCGLELLQQQRVQNPDSKQSLFILVTGNTSQTAVARAAEEDVDTYIIKPFTAGILRSSIMKCALAKIRPSEYVVTINAGKAQLTEGKTDESMETFKKAATLDPAPSLAYFYFGHANVVKEVTETAEGSFNKGLAYNKIHYKCLVGLFDILMKQKRHHEAYDAVKKISQYFPANPQRLTQVLKLAIITQSYDDVERYYQVFTRIDERSEETIKYICAALVVCGKYYLQKKIPSRAQELFTKAAATASGRGKILKEIILPMLEYGMAKEAETYLKRFPPDQQSGVDFLALDFLIKDKIADNPSLSIALGRALISKEIAEPNMYETLIKRHIEGGLFDAAQSLIDQALKKWPDEKRRFDPLPALLQAAETQKKNAAKPQSPPSKKAA